VSDSYSCDEATASTRFRVSQSIRSAVAVLVVWLSCCRLVGAQMQRRDWLSTADHHQTLLALSAMLMLLLLGVMWT